VSDQRAFTDRSYKTFLSEEQLMGARCNDCGRLFVPPRSLCPTCHGDNLNWEQASGQGRLVAMTNMAMVAPDLAAEGYGGDRPYCIGVVQLDEGPRVVARLDDGDTDARGGLEIGQDLQVQFECLDRQTPRLVFRPA
jgi:uncharacterized OB-fold protein